MKFNNFSCLRKISAVTCRRKVIKNCIVNTLFKILMWNGPRLPFGRNTFSKLKQWTKCDVDFGLFWFRWFGRTYKNLIQMNVTRPWIIILGQNIPHKPKSLTYPEQYFLNPLIRLTLPSLGILLSNYCTNISSNLSLT